MNFLNAETVQILHTNDLHGYFENSGFERDRGGFGALKLKIDELKNLASYSGIKTLTVDAGDFLEGSLYYLADFGAFNFRMMDSLNYDAVAVGNHDWLMGTRALDDLLNRAQFRFSLLSANLVINKPFKIFYPHIEEKIKPYKIIELNNYKVAILGLSTSDPLYSWRLNDGKIEDPISVAKKYVKILKKERKVDFIIALTHLGSHTDLKLAKKVPEIDLIIGGHDHRTIEVPLEVKHKNKIIPIVQTGSWARSLGQLVVDLDLVKGLKVVKYHLHPVKNDEVDFDEVAKVEEGQILLNELYGKEYLKEEVGNSSIPLIYSEENSTIWSKIVVEAIREGGNGEVAINTGSLAGQDLPPGKITRQDLINTFPRFFEFDEKYGWKVYKTNVMGFLLETTVQLCLSQGYHLDWSGLTFKIKNHKNGSRSAYNIRVNGKRLNPLKLYRMGVPEGIVRGGMGITPMVGLILIASGYTKTTMWQSIEDKIKAIGPIDWANPKVKEIEDLVNYQFVPRALKD